MRRYVLFVCVLLQAAAALAHQPKAVCDAVSSPNAPFSVKDPEISQAFYGCLKKAPDYYLVESSSPFRLYLNILSPAIAGARRDYSIEVNGTRVIDAADGAWEKFYEPYAGDVYWRGPEFERDAGPGRYAVKVTNPGNTGKYVLAVGKTESFTFRESVRTLLQLPKLKTGYFGKPFFAVYEGIIGKILILMTLFIVAAAVVPVLLAVRRKKDRAAAAG
jgi:hypothetical protein